MRIILITLAAVFLVVSGGALVMMNNACKTSHHSWCRPLNVSGSGSGHHTRLRNGGPPRVQPASS